MAKEAGSDCGRGLNVKRKRRDKSTSRNETMKVLASGARMPSPEAAGGQSCTASASQKRKGLNCAKTCFGWNSCLIWVPPSHTTFLSPSPPGGGYSTHWNKLQLYFPSYLQIPMSLLPSSFLSMTTFGVDVLPGLAAAGAARGRGTASLAGRL